jgi:GntR family transcriptional regulator
MPHEDTPPKDAQIVAELQRRIESGEYPPGSLLPSEHQLSAEFGTARPTVARAASSGAVRPGPGMASGAGRPSWTGTSPASPAS